MAKTEPNWSGSRNFIRPSPARWNSGPSRRKRRAPRRKSGETGRVQLGLAELAILLEATGGDVARIAVEIEKLRLYAGRTKVTAEDIAALVPDAQATTISPWWRHGPRRPARALADSGHACTRRRVYAAGTDVSRHTIPDSAGGAGGGTKERRGQIQAHFNKLGARMWPERARQIEQTVKAFPQGEAGTSGSEVIPGRPSLARCASGRSNRDGRNDPRADRLRPAVCGGAA